MRATQCEAVTNTGTDVIRCTRDAHERGLCGYHAKMSRGLLEPGIRVSEVRSTSGVRLYPAGAR